METRVADLGKFERLAAEWARFARPPVDRIVSQIHAVVLDVADGGWLVASTFAGLLPATM